MKKHSLTGKFALAAAAAVALGVVGISPAFAADITVSPDEIAPVEHGDESAPDYNYDTWHISQDTDAAATLDQFFDFAQCSAESVSNQSQLLLGYDPA